MMEQSNKKQGFKKCRSATFSIDGFSFTIVANEEGDSNARPFAQFSRSKSQSCLWNALTGAASIKENKKPVPFSDSRTPEDILADEFPSVEHPDAMEKAAVRLACSD
ncbi:calcium/calmodulin-dependent 3',5'-cyclic nucleotide phosphodiesterase 1C-like [Protopterus annectens]|uniref:calcium/calmodulin-dependent 3',5'-cyclic nucleotide phosphodiesterase 1C-like n=1 Tax=Protopterus annectens TaxID=7888 RepID=UPI001CF96A72|nr:calcium/calmodulin-dependent 3',5'-cyclic nucleotide phosphodiesterase 1C-like [Protopterus annectens]